MLSNAFKFTNEGSLSIEIKDITSQNESLSSMKTIVFKTVDTGIGIDKDKQEVIFNQFEKLQTSESLNPDGFGLGLVIC